MKDFDPKSIPDSVAGKRVGYKRPPTAHQFKKGKSGNPRGRPRGGGKAASLEPSPTSLEEVLLKEACRQIEIRENGKVEKMPMIQAVLRSLGVTAAKGNYRAQMAIFGMAQAVEQRNLNSKQQLFEAILDFKKSWEVEFAECDRRGQPRPEVVPHPDDLTLNARTGEVFFNGPWDDGEKALWDRINDITVEAKEEVARLRRKKTRASLDDKKKFDDLIRIKQDIVDRFEAFIPDEKTRRRPDFNISEWRQRKRKLLDLKRSIRSAIQNRDDGGG